VLQHPEVTKNRRVYVRDTATTLEQFSTTSKKALRGESGDRKENFVAINELYQQAMVESKKDQLNADIYIIDFIKTSILGDGYGYRQMKTG